MDRRAASEVVGVVLLFGLVLIGVVLIAMSGGSAVDQVQQQNEYSTAQTSMQELKTELTTVVQDSSQEETTFQMGDQRTDDMRILDDGWINFTVNGEEECFSANRSLGSVEYNSSNGRRVAYQANAVFEKDDENVEIVSRPGLEYRQSTSDNGYTVRSITFELANVNASNSSVQGNEITAEPERDGRSMTLLQCTKPTPGPGSGTITRSVDWVNNVTVEVSNNAFYKGWEQVFREEFSEVLGAGEPGDLDVFDANRTVRVTVPLGVAADDDNDGVPDPDDPSGFSPPMDFDPSDPGDYADDASGSDYVDYVNEVPDNCPPAPEVEEPPNSSIQANYTNYGQVDSDGDDVGDVCDPSPYGGGSSGSGGTPDVNQTPTMNLQTNKSSNSYVNNLAPGENVEIQPNPADAEGDTPYSWSWSFKSGSAPGNLLNAGTQNPVYVPPESLGSDEFVTILGTVTDSAGQTTTRKVTIRIDSPGGTGSTNVPPTAILRNTTSLIVNESGANVGLDASASFDPGAGGGITSYSWGISCSLSDCGSISGSGATATYSPPSNVDGYEIVTAEVTVSDGPHTDTDTIRMLVLDQDNSGSTPPTFNSPPTAVAQADDRIVIANNSEPLSGALSQDADGDSLNYSWSKVDPSDPGTIVDSNSVSPTFELPDSMSGNETVAIRLTVDDGASSDTDRVVLSAFGGSSVTDGDGDGIPDGQDECPSYDGTGVNGCQGISEQGDRLRVNQSNGTLTFAGSMVAKLNESIAERPPIDVSFVLDRSGSMVLSGYGRPAEDQGTPRYIFERDNRDWGDSGYYDSDGDSAGEWTRFAAVSGGSPDYSSYGEYPGKRGFSAGSFTVPSGIELQVGEGASSTIYTTGDTVNLNSDDRVRTRVAPGASSATVPTGEVWQVRDTDGDVSSDTPFTIGGNKAKWVYPGESFDPSKWETYLVATFPGSDPYNQRVTATKDFIGALKSGTDRAGFVEFNTEANKVHGLSYNLPSVNSSIRGIGQGGTDITSGIRAATDQLTPDNSSRDEYIVLLSDGRNTDDDTSDSETIDAARDAADEGITIYTVALGSGADDALLRDVAQETGGEAFEISNADEIQGVFEEIAGEVVENKVRRVEHRAINGTVNVNGSSFVDIGSYVYNPAAPGTKSQFVDPAGDSFTLSVDGSVYACRNPSDTGEDYTNGSKSYNETTCDPGRRLSGFTNTSPVVFTNGDDLPGPSSPLMSPDPWETDLETLVSQYTKPGDTDINASGQFQLGPNEAYFAMRMPNESFVLLHFQANDTPTSGGCTSGADCLNASDEPPTAIATTTASEDNRANASETVSLTGSQSFEPNGSIASYSWSVSCSASNCGSVSGSGATADYQAPSTLPSSDVTVKVNLTVTDDDGQQDRATVRIGLAGSSSTPGNSPPQADLSVSPEVVEVGDTATLDASGSFDPDGSIDTYDWTVTQGGGSISGSGSTVDYSPPTSGLSGPEKVVVELEVTDDDGSTDVKKVKFVQTPSGPSFNRPPNVALSKPGDGVVQPGSGNSEDISIDTANDPDGSITSTGWSVSCPISSCGSVDTSGSTPKYRPPTPGSLPPSAGDFVVNVTYTVEDDGSPKKSASDKVRIGVDVSGSAGGGGGSGGGDNGWVIGIGGGEIEIGDGDDDD